MQLVYMKTGALLCIFPCLFFPDPLWSLPFSASVPSQINKCCYILPISLGETITVSQDISTLRHWWCYQGIAGLLRFLSRKGPNAPLENQPSLAWLHLNYLFSKVSLDTATRKYQLKFLDIVSNLALTTFSVHFNYPFLNQCMNYQERQMSGGCTEGQIQVLWTFIVTKYFIKSIHMLSFPFILALRWVDRTELSETRTFHSCLVEICDHILGILTGPLEYH